MAILRMQGIDREQIERFGVIHSIPQRRANDCPALVIELACLPDLEFGDPITGREPYTHLVRAIDEYGQYRYYLVEQDSSREASAL